jgi:hypothetical protein
VGRFLFLIVLGVLAMDATGVEALVLPEPCTSAEQTQSDGACPPLCARCVCCAQPIVPEIAMSIVSTPVQQGVIEVCSGRIPQTVPSKVFHVPKFASPAI